MSKTALCACLAALLPAALLPVCGASTQDVRPAKPVIIVPFVPGGNTDLFGRLLADEMSGGEAGNPGGAQPPCSAGPQGSRRTGSASCGT